MLFEAQIFDLRHLFPWLETRREQKAIRAIVEQRRRILTKEQIEADSARIIVQIEQMSAFHNAKTVLIYYPIHNEVDLRPLLAKYADQKTFLFPVTHRHSMEVRPYDGEDMMRRGRYGVPEPQTETYNGPIDLMLIPGVVFDRHCNRIGRGGGFYDRFLWRHPHSVKIGVCYDFQLKKHTLPIRRFRDHKMDRVVTPQQTIG